MEENHLTIVLQTLLSLVSDYAPTMSKQEGNSRSDQLINHLSTLLEQNILRRLDMYLGRALISQVKWPNQCHSGRQKPQMRVW